MNNTILFVDIAEKEYSDADDDSFCVISSDMASQSCIYLFARADREKEEWYEAVNPMRFCCI